MAIMDYVTPGLTKIEFEDSLFVTTELDGDENKVVKGYIESRGGVIKNSVTKTTDYLIYKDGEEETTKYRKALELIRDKGLEIRVLSLKTFSDLVSMRDTPDISEICIKGKRLVAAGLDNSDRKALKEHLKKHGGIVGKSVTTGTDYLIYPDPSSWGNNWENQEYAKALSLMENGDSGITILSFSTFVRLSRKSLGTVELGTYPFEKDGTRQPVQWMVLKEEDGKALLFSAYGIDIKPYNNKQEDITWETCILRKWLNKTFYNKAFTKEEKKRILLTTVENPDNPAYGTKGGNDTEDRVFLLSIREAEEWLTRIERMPVLTPFASMPVPTPFAKSKDGYSWWLRSPGDGSRSAALVYYDGGLYDLGRSVHGSYAVCPALWIDLDSDI